MLWAVVIGVLAGVVAGMLGVGGGSLFVPALVIFLGLSHVEAEATSLLAIVPVALVGSWRQHRYGNVDVRDAVLLGVLATVGAGAGVVLANTLPERALKLGFAAVLVYAAWRLARSALRGEPAATAER